MIEHATDSRREKFAMRVIRMAAVLFSLVSLTLAVEDVVTAIHGTIAKIDREGKVIAVKTADGADHTFHWAKDTAVHGARATDVDAKDAWHGLKEGSEVVLHATRRGAEDIVIEVDKVGDDGVKKTEGTVKEIDRVGRRLVVKTADGTEHTFRLTRRATMDAGKDLAAGMEKGAKVAVYSTEDAGTKVAHFFEKIYRR